MSWLGGRLTSLQGATVLVSDSVGDVHDGSIHGFYHCDVRYLSKHCLTMGGKPLTVLAASRQSARSARWIYLLAADSHGSPTAILQRTRRVADGLLVDALEAKVYRGHVDAVLTIDLAADFASVLEVKDGPAKGRDVPLSQTGWALAGDRDGHTVCVVANHENLEVETGRLTWPLRLGEGQVETLQITASVEHAEDSGSDHGSDHLHEQPGLDVRSSDSAWRQATATALDDLRALRISAPDRGVSYTAAGAPWFTALFGRDALITAWEQLLTGSEAALETLTALARHQGRRVHPETNEQPGRILHVLRTGHMGPFGRDPDDPYYGTVDATPLFVMLLAEAHRWGGDPNTIRRLLPAARAAIEWCTEYGDLDGDGFLEYRADATGLVNQGWKDSDDAIVHADGRLAEGPIALAEVQAYFYSALQGLADLEDHLGTGDGAALRKQARALRHRFREAFWLPDEQILALGLDGAGRPLAVASSNMGHCLWSGICDDAPHVVDGVADRLVAPELLTAWGIRTLGATEIAYNPLAYHLGSVWPHDTAIGAAGLARVGRGAAVRRICWGLLDAARAFDWRLPELLGGFDEAELALPVPYPAACSPQAWSSGAPLLLLRAILGLEPDVPNGVIHLDPLLEDGEELVVRGIDIGGQRLSVHARGSNFDVPEGIDGIRVIHGRPHCPTEKAPSR